MRSIEELRQVLRRQWDNSRKRELRLFGGENAWPILLSIGRPSPRLVRSQFDSVKRHIESWRRVSHGQVIWQDIRYRDTASSIPIPMYWRLDKPTEWEAACADKVVSHEFRTLSELAERIDAIFHPLLVRRRGLWRDKPVAEIIQAADLAQALEPGIAGGRPLRMLSLAGIDTKFFERNERLVTALLDVRFDDEVGVLGLESFLGACPEADHWLLVVDLDGALLPFRSQRVRSSELSETALPGHRMLVVENECCLHQLPSLSGAIAVLGAGFDLGWLANPTFRRKRIAYWGDIDTWGLQFLAHARRMVGDLEPLMMTSEIILRFKESTVVEPIIADREPPEGLSAPEQTLYRQLVQSPRGRLEQEFLPQAFVHKAVSYWLSGDAESRAHG